MKIIAKLLTVAFCGLLFATAFVSTPAQAAGKMGVKHHHHHVRHHRRHHRMSGRRMIKIAPKKHM